MGKILLLDVNHLIAKFVDPKDIKIFSSLLFLPRKPIQSTTIWTSLYLHQANSFIQKLSQNISNLSRANI